ncbi:MAG: extracellular solute-binding protein [Microbacteriaceae bacterium]|nr:extracellular solute-binding protein [Microbacteriaceae bacterium]
MMSKRSLPIALAAILLGSVTVAGCSSSSGEGAAEKINVVLHDNPPTNKALITMTKVFEKENPSITVKISFIPIADWAATRTARLSAKQVDITEGVTGPGATPLPDYVKGAPQSVWMKGVEAGNWVDLSGQKMLDNFIPTVIAALKIEGKSYQVPTSLNYVNGVFYNKEIFAKVGVEVPKTWGSFKTVLAKIKAAKIIPISAGGKDNWPVGLIAIGAAQSLYPTLAEQQALDKGLWANTVKLNDEKNVQVVDRVNTIYQYIDPSFAGVDYSTAQGQFASGQAAMTVDGTWAASQFLATNPALKMGFFPLPVSDTAADNRLGGKIDFTFVVPSATKHKAAAIKWLDFFSQKSNYAAFATAGGIIPAQADVALSPALESVKPSLTGEFDLAWDQVFHSNANAGSNVGPVGFNYSGLSPVGALKGAQAAQDAAQTDWAAGLAK